MTSPSSHVIAPKGHDIAASDCKDTNRAMQRLMSVLLAAAITALVVAGFFWLRDNGGDAALGAVGAKVQAMAAFGYARAPEIMIALVAAALVLPIGCVLLFSRWMQRNRHLRQLYAAAQVEPVPTCDDAFRTRPSARAWLEVAGTGAHIAHAITREIIRIGSDADNDLVLHDEGVQPFHAVLRRAPDGDFVIFDISGVVDVADAGVMVNGNRPISAPLRNDDVIELGTVRMTFKRRAAAMSRQLAAVPETTTA